MAEIKQFNITVDELGDQNLEQKDKPSFSYVTTIIQSASSKAKNKVPTPSDGYAPMDLDAINAIKTTRPLYSAPHRRPPPVLKQEHPKTSLSIDKAQRFRGKPLNEVLKNWYGDACHYCKQVGHWYNNCAAFWDDVDKKVIDPPPRDYNTPESNYLPLTNLHTPKTDCANLKSLKSTMEKFFFDSGASTHIQGLSADHDTEGTIEFDDVLFLPRS
ncbi:Dcp1p-Dcp2p decapping enzyme complex alpha subunit [Puccinia graminis f. sp. tritici]|uniref:Dcp1p-Dcp2p decapping enzyme complex alpha subunit n=1 Tax=Puccinia graminis f. sp. tritici TaxID=56615 RepID=A0A5B0QBH5_PUCGR|nr:Dcp1p-Dcp2p decapping enzyme complex alpha subunit [Puccinia graminis f. sp. tritici]